MAEKEKHTEKPTEDQSNLPFDPEQLESFHLAFPKEGHIVVDGEMQSFWIRLETFAKVKPGQDPAEVYKGMYEFLSAAVNYMIQTERKKYEDKPPEYDFEQSPPEW